MFSCVGNGIFRKLMLVSWCSASNLPKPLERLHPQILQNEKEIIKVIAFLVNSDLTLRAQLTEFIDHKLIRNKNLEGMDYLVIPLDNLTLQEFIEKYKTAV